MALEEEEFLLNLEQQYQDSIDKKVKKESLKNVKPVPEQQEENVQKFTSEHKQQKDMKMEEAKMKKKNRGEIGVEPVVPELNVVSAGSYLPEDEAPDYEGLM